MVQGALDELIEWISRKKTVGGMQGGGKSVADVPAVQTNIGKASAYLDAARRVVAFNVHEISTTDPQAITVEMRVRYRRDYAFASELCVRAVDLLFQSAGGSGIMLSNGVQRAWRDVNCASHHVGLNWEAYSILYGRHSLGLQLQGQF
jgi:3-hydroxy-9,10-secoandrosta-1,3,5(10)-triene-9,17-dione monooxygenase